MVGILTNDQINQVLRTHLVGRIGYSDGAKLYVIPIAYVFDGKYIYAHSGEGNKIKCIRKNPQLCFEVDAIENMGNWQSVVVHGKYEELKSGATLTKAVKMLNDRFVPYVTSESSKPSHGLPRGPERVEKQKHSIVFRISVTEATGRYEIHRIA